MKISTSIALSILFATASLSSARVVRVVNRNGEDSPESIKNRVRTSASPRLGVSQQASASIGSPFASSELLFGNSSNSATDANNDDKNSTTAPPAVVESPYAPFPEGGTLRLAGLDPSVPLTPGEAAFLEEAIKRSFNKFHQDHGVDRLVKSVAVDKGIVAVADVAFDLEHSSNRNNRHRSLLRGGNKPFRQPLPDEIRKPMPERVTCHYHYKHGPEKDRQQSTCIFNIDVVIDREEKDDRSLDISNAPTAAPTIPPRDNKDPMLTPNAPVFGENDQTSHDDDDDEKDDNDDDSLHRKTKNPTEAVATTEPDTGLEDEEEEQQEQHGPRKLLDTSRNLFYEELLHTLQNQNEWKRFQMVQAIRFRGWPKKLFH